MKSEAIRSEETDGKEIGGFRGAEVLDGEERFADI